MNAETADHVKEVLDLHRQIFEAHVERLEDAISNVKELKRHDLDAAEKAATRAYEEQQKWKADQEKWRESVTKTLAIGGTLVVVLQFLITHFWK